jgi:hypothetical protein
LRALLRESPSPVRRAWLRADLTPAGLGAGLGFASIATYAADGYSRPTGLLWLAALVLLGLHFLRVSDRLPRPAAIDVAIPMALTAVVAPLYVVGLYRWPVQVGSDELAIASAAKTYAHQANVDLFGTSNYFGHPAVLFVVWGKLGDLLGGIDLADMRLLHAITGLLGIGLSYAFFRQLLPRAWSAFATLLLALNHAFLMISRLAMRENTVVLVEVVALALLLLGFRRDHPFATFCAGVAIGVGFYVHFPGRSIALVAAAFLVSLALWFRKELGGARLLRLSAIAATGFALVATPYVIAYEKAPADVTAHQRQSLLIYEAGRKEQQGWVFASSELAGVAKNIQLGLTAFNVSIQDHSWIYANPHHGIVDPLTGVLLWIGAGVVLVVRIRRRREPWPLVGLAGFLVLWIAFAFVVGQAPDYPRMLLMLPLVAYLVTEAVRSVAGAVAGRSGRSWMLPAVGAAALLGIVAWNGLIARDYLRAGQGAGDPIGSTGRFVEAHRNVPGMRFYVAANDRQPYFVWGQKIDRLALFVSRPDQLGGMVEPSSLAAFSAPTPFDVFMSRDLWSANGRELERRYPLGRLENITPDGRLVVLQVPSSV